MTLPRLLLFASTLALLSACTTQRKPPPRPLPAPTSTPVAVVPAPPPADWRDAAITPGTWTYGATVAGARAAFSAGAGEALLALACQRGTGQISVIRAGAASGNVPLTVTTTSQVRAFTAAPDLANPQSLTVTLPARDPLLDAMAFSRGRFMIEVPGLPTLYLPAWPEVGRVIEDCR
jgi:hypothetical protein